MKNISVFQIVVLAVFIFVAIVGIAVFAGFGGIGSTSIPKAVIWGTVPSGVVNEVVRNVNAASNVIDVTYVEKNPDTFEADFINALAEGNGPDAVILSDDMLYAERNKLQPIPYTTFAQRDYLNTFIDDASIFLSKNGVLAVPVSVDPIVMYWNKNIFANAGIPRAPLTWSELSADGPAIIKKTDASVVTTALLPFGEYSNVQNAKQILATLLFQANNPITQIDPTDDSVHFVIDQTNSDTSGNTNTNAGETPAENVLNFYTSFANPSKQLYTWNTSLPNSLDAFLAGNVAMYFGYASELGKIQNKNPNLNFDVSSVPQDPNGLPVTYGKITGLAIVKQTRNFAGALGVVSKMTEAGPIKIWADLVNLPAVRRDVLSTPAKDSYMTVFNRSAVQAKSWYDPDPKETDSILSDMVESITTGRKKTADSITDARQKLDRLLKK